MNLPQVDTEYVTGNKVLYRVHCLTFGMAKEIFGYSRECNLATPGNHTLATFRAYPPYRRQGAKALRAEVCAALRFNRAGERLKHSPEAKAWAKKQAQHWSDTAGREMRQP